MESVISENSMNMFVGKVELWLSWQMPQSVKDLQMFIGVANFDEQFIENLSLVITPLTELTKGNHLQFVRGPRKLKAIDLMKSLLTTAAILSHFRFGKTNLSKVVDLGLCFWTRSVPDDK